MHRKLRVALFVTLCVAQAVVMACGFVFPTKLSSSAGSDATTALPDGGPDGHPDTGAPDTSRLPTDAMTSECGTEPPGPPNTLAQYGSDSIIAAIKTIYYTQDAGPMPDLGFDLDCVDTCPGPKSCISPNADCDLSGGRDVAANEFLVAFESLEGKSASQSLNGRIAAGLIGSFVWLSGYNGEADDSEVFVASLASTGTLLDHDGGTHIPPSWDGNDVWYVDTDSAQLVTIADGGYHYLPTVVSTMAYVSNYTLVAGLSNVPLEFFGTDVVLSNVVMVAKITPLPGVGYELDGQLAGRVAMSALFKYVGSLKDPVDNTQFLCGQDETFQSILMGLCASADIMADPQQDNATPQMPCDALSAAVGFTAISAKLGPQYPHDPYTYGCDGSIAQCP